MVTTFIVLAVVISILLILVVLVQKSKGGGLASNFAGSNQIMGVRRTTNFIEKTTWTLAAIIAVLAILSGIVLEKSNSQQSGPAFKKQQTTTETTQKGLPGDILPGANNTDANAGTPDNQ